MIGLDQRISILAATENHLEGFKKKSVPRNILEQLSQNLWLWDPGLNVFKFPQLIPLCNQGWEPLA